MFKRLFSESGLSLERLRALVEVGAAGSIVRAAEGEPVRQSQYSRQLKELEDFFQTSLVERHGRGIRLTASGRELARISRFFLLGLSNFQRGCLAEGQAYRIGGSPTFVASFLLPMLAERKQVSTGIRFTVETARQEQLERKLHDLTLDFAIVACPALSRPLQLQELGRVALKLWVPKRCCRSEKQATQALSAGSLPVVWAAEEMGTAAPDLPGKAEPALVCATFVEAQVALTQQALAGLLPDFLSPPNAADFLQHKLPAAEGWQIIYRFAWNPRLLRLNRHARRRRDELIEGLKRRLAQ